MASMRDIKRRIRSVNSTKQITKAMNLVASSKLTRAKNRFTDTKPFFDQTQRVIAEIAKGSKGVTHPYLTERDVNKTAVIMISGDRGLCGGYNANVCKLANRIISEKGKDKSALITIGNRGKDYFNHKGVEFLESYRGISEKPTYQDALTIGQKALDLFASGEVDEVYLVYTEYITTISSEAKAIKLLPLNIDDFKTEEDNKSLTLTIYEPNEEAVLDYVIPKYINTVIYGALVESAVCELGARMTAMDSATENASEMIDKLNLLYNRVRQGAITQELTEIVSGSNALE
jgi:F-type H+-transporting ATPase subunit gamma